VSVTSTPTSPAAHTPTPRAAFGLLRERQWATALLGVIVLSCVFVLLGNWQWGRYERRSAADTLVDNNYDATPAPLAELLPDVGVPLPRHLEYRPVEVTGAYLNDQSVLLRNRPNATGGNGYDVVVPFATTGGPVFYVDRGWIPAGTTTAARPDSVPAPPTGTVTVVARLRPSEPASSRRAPAGQANRLTPAVLGRGLGRPVVSAYGELMREAPAAAGTPAAPDRPDPGLYAINLAYAFQWVAFAVAAYVLFGVALVREVRRRQGRPDVPMSERLRAWRPNLGDQDE
jgi:cytochrome oxidase assembly protein ShyY1